MPPISRLVVLLVFLLCTVLPGVTNAQTAARGVIHGVVTTQGGTLRLPGVDVVVKNNSGTDVAQLLSSEDGQFTVPAVPPGQYVITMSLSGFVAGSTTVTVDAARTTEVSLDLPLAAFSANVVVVAASPVVSQEGTLAPSESIKGDEVDQFLPSGGVQASLRLLSSIIQVPGGVSIKGGRPSQAGFQLGSGTLVDPSTGLAQISIPPDAIDSVAVLPNPYAVEYGRFSSGLVLIQTRRAGDTWKVRFNEFDPALRIARGTLFDVQGVEWWGPRVEVGGPLIKDRLFLEQSAQFRYSARDVPSLPENLLRTSLAFSSFTRLDANLSSNHTLVASIGIFPGVAKDATLGTFIPPDAAVDLHTNANEVAVTERAIWGKSLFGETTVQVHSYRTDVEPHGSAPMQLLPDTTNGNFFNTQLRNTRTYQVIESLSGTHEGFGGLHLFKVGFDLLDSHYDAQSASRSVLIGIDPDGPVTMTRRLDYGAPSAQSIHSTDVAVFAQDRFQPNARWYAEVGVRLDRDGVIDRFNATPRLGTAILLNESGSAVLRGGFGLFFERTPSIAGVFNEFQRYADTRYASDGVTPLGPPVDFRYTTAPDLQTPRSRTWDVGFDHRVNKNWSFHVGAIERQSSHELIVEPEQIGTVGAVLLSSDGRSTYREADVNVHYTRGTAVDFNVSYARSQARADLNALTAYFDAILSPVVGVNAFAPANSDVPNRLLARGRVMPTPRWLVLGTLDWRSGLPYSAVNGTLDFVGPRNSLRFPTYARLEIGVERRFKIGKFQPWIGIRAWNALNAFLPTDVQANLASPEFGSFYNSEYRQFRLQIRFER